MYQKLKLNYARNSLRYIIRTYHIEEMHIPYYLCDEVRHSIIKENCKPAFYHIDDDFMPVCKFKKSDYILYPNYFGICDNNVQKLVQIYPKLIVDNAHSFYSEPIGFACFNSQRKFENVSCGSYLWIKKAGEPLEYQDIPKIPPQNRELYENIICKYEPFFIKDLKTNNQNNKIRLEKFIFLYNKYATTNSLNINLTSCSSPFCYPFLAKSEKEADNFVKNLQNEGLEIYRYWNCLPKSYPEYKFYKKLVPIPLTS